MAIVSMKGKLRRDQAQAKDYTSWYEITRRLEGLDGSTEWRDTDASPEYDYALVARRLDTIRQMRRSSRIRDLMHHLRQNLHWNSGNIGSPALYERSLLGTKFLIAKVNIVVKALLD